MSRSESWVVQSMLPAAGWFARIDTTDVDGEKFDSPLVCWALVKFGEVVEVVGLMATDEVIIADEMEGFMCYIHESEIQQSNQPPPIELDKERGDESK